MKALVNLIKKYKTITLEQLKGLFNEENTSGDDVMRLVTGFGDIESCSICEDARQKAPKRERYSCEYCIYRKLFPNTDPDSLYCINDSYYRISEADTAEELYEAIQERIQVLEEAIENYESIRVYKR